MVLAGGRSERFGSRDKLAYPIRGRPLLHYPIAALAGVCDEVIVVLAADTDESAAPLPGDVPALVRVVHDPEPDGGPLVGVVAGLAEARTQFSVVVAGDMPDIVPAVIRAMIAIAEEREAQAVALAVGEDVVPLPCVLAAVAREVGQSLLRNKETSLRALLRALQAVAISEPDWRALDPNGDTFHDIDEPEQLP